MFVESESTGATFESYQAEPIERHLSSGQSSVHVEAWPLSRFLRSRSRGRPAFLQGRRRCAAFKTRQETSRPSALTFTYSLFFSFLIPLYFSFAE